jgi:hypothetical protein
MDSINKEGIMELTLSDIKAIGNKRYNDKYWKRHGNMVCFFVLGLLFAVIGLIGAGLSSSQFVQPINTYKDLKGDTIQVRSPDDVVVVGDNIYLLSIDKDGVKEVKPDRVINGFMFWVTVFGLLLMCGIALYVVYKTDDFVSRFVQHWVDKKEILEAD